MRGAVGGESGHTFPWGLAMQGRVQGGGGRDAMYHKSCLTHDLSNSYDACKWSVSMRHRRALRWGWMHMHPPIFLQVGYVRVGVRMHHAMNSNAYTMCHVLCIWCRQYGSEIVRENRVHNDTCNIWCDYILLPRMFTTRGSGCDRVRKCMVNWCTPYKIYLCISYIYIPP